MGEDSNVTQVCEALDGGGMMRGVEECVGIGIGIGIGIGCCGLEATTCRPTCSGGGVMMIE